MVALHRRVLAKLGEQATIENLLSKSITQHLLDMEDSQIDSLVSGAATMQLDIERGASRCASLEQSLNTLQSESQTLLTLDAAPAMDNLLALVHSVESLHYATQQDASTLMPGSYSNPTSAFEVMQTRAPLVNACKSQSQVVFTHFRSLTEKARNLTQRFTQLATDFTFEISTAQERIERLRDMVRVAETLRNGVESQRNNWYGQKATAETHIVQARETIRSAEHRRNDLEGARIARNIFTLGLGEAFDWWDLNKGIGDAMRTVASAQENVRSCEQSIERAMAALQRISDQVACLNTLGNTVRNQETTLQGNVSHGQALRTRTVDLTNASLDVTLFVGTLAAKSETLSVHRTAQEFAQGVMNFGRVMVSDGRLNGLLVQQDPLALQDTLDMIARTDPVDGSGRFIETQPRLAIEDMM